MTEREKMFAGKIYDPFSEGMLGMSESGVPYRVIREITEADRLSAHPEYFAD